jgi:hypothetical protein
MLYDHRTYFCKQGAMQKQIELYRAHGFAAQIRHIGRPVLFATTEVGDLNSYVHVWAYASMEERSRKREAMQSDPEWQAYVRLSREAGHLLRQENTFLQSVTFPPAAI